MSVLNKIFVSWLLCLIINVNFNVFAIVSINIYKNGTINFKNVGEEHNIDSIFKLSDVRGQRSLGLTNFEGKQNDQTNNSQRRGLFDNFPPDRGTNTTFLSDSFQQLKENPPRSILFFTTCILLAAITYGSLNVFELRIITYEAMLLFFAIGLGILSKLHPIIDNFTLVAHMTPKLMMMIFLPVLVLNSVFSLDTYLMKTSIWKVMLIGVVGFFIQAPLTVMIMVPLIYKGTNMHDIVLFGALCSVTNPSESTKVLNKIGDFKQISVILEGEGIILLTFTTFTLNLVITLMNKIESTLFKWIMYDIFQQSIGAIALGVFSGWLSKFLFLCLITNKVVVNLVMISIAYILFYLCTIEWDLSAILCVLSYCMILNLEKSAMSNEDEQNTLNLLKFLTFVANSVIFIMAGIVATEHVLTNIHIYSVTSIVTLPLIYVVVFALRCAILTGLSYITKCIGYSVTYNHIPLLVFGGSRGLYALCYSLAINKSFWQKHRSSQFLLHVISLVFFSVLLNSNFIKLAVRWLHKVDDIKVLNMKLALKSLSHKRCSTIEMLKTKKELTQTNWFVVEESTKIKFPYNTTDEEEITEIWTYKKQFKEASCPECKRLSLLRPQNISDMREHILKRKKVQIRRCYDQGFMSSVEAKKMLAAINTAYNSQEKILDIKLIRSVWHPNIFLQRVNNKLVRIPRKHTLKQPELLFNRLMFRIFSFKYYTVVIYVINLLYILAAVPLVICNCKEEHLSPAVLIALEASIYIFYLLFVIDFIIKVLALNIRNYFKSHWKILDFVLLAFSTADIAIALARLSVHNFKLPQKTSEINLWLRGLRILHLLKIIRLPNYYGKQLYDFIDKRTQLRLLSGYTIAECYIKSQDEVIRQLETLYERTLNEDLLREVDQKTTVLIELGDIHTKYPQIPISVSTKHVSRQVLNDMMLNINYLNEQGLIDDNETAIIKQSVSKQIKKINTMKLVDAFPPSLVVKQIPWLFDDQYTYNLMMKYSTAQNLEKNENIITAGDSPIGLNILVSGVATTKYVYSKYASNNLKEFGYLPNCDFMMHLNFEINDKHEDVLYPGAVLGELGLLNHTNYNYTARCDTKVVVIHIPLDIMHIALTENVKLEANIWKTVSIRIAMHISKSVFRFQKMNIDKLRYKLQTGYVPKLSDFRSIELKDIADCCFLIQGLVINPVDQTVYKAPAFIPETVRTLVNKSWSISIFTGIENPNEKEMKLLIIPRRENEKFSVESGDFGKYVLVADPPEFCEFHAAELAWKKENQAFLKPASKKKTTMGFTWLKKNLSSHRSESK